MLKAHLPKAPNPCLVLTSSRILRTSKTDQLSSEQVLVALPSQTITKHSTSQWVTKTIMRTHRHKWGTLSVNLTNIRWSLIALHTRVVWLSFHRKGVEISFRLERTQTRSKTTKVALSIGLRPEGATNTTLMESSGHRYLRRANRSATERTGTYLLSHHRYMEMPKQQSSGESHSSRMEKCWRATLTRVEVQISMVSSKTGLSITHLTGSDKLWIATQI